MDEGCSLQGSGGPINRPNNKKIHKKIILASKTRKKTQKNMCPTRKNNFFKIWRQPAHLYLSV